MRFKEFLNKKPLSKEYEGWLKTKIEEALVVRKTVVLEGKYAPKTGAKTTLTLDDWKEESGASDEELVDAISTASGGTEVDKITKALNDPKQAEQLFKSFSQKLQNAVKTKNKEDITKYGVALKAALMLTDTSAAEDVAEKHKSILDGIDLEDVKAGDAVSIDALLKKVQEKIAKTEAESKKTEEKSPEGADEEKAFENVKKISEELLNELDRVSEIAKTDKKKAAVKLGTVEDTIEKIQKKYGEIAKKTIAALVEKAKEVATTLSGESTETESTETKTEKKPEETKVETTENEELKKAIESKKDQNVLDVISKNIGKISAEDVDKAAALFVENDKAKKTDASHYTQRKGHYIILLVSHLLENNGKDKITETIKNNVNNIIKEVGSDKLEKYLSNIITNEEERNNFKNYMEIKSEAKESFDNNSDKEVLNEAVPGWNLLMSFLHTDAPQKAIAAEELIDQHKVEIAEELLNFYVKNKTTLLVAFEALKSVKDAQVKKEMSEYLYYFFILHQGKQKKWFGKDAASLDKLAASDPDLQAGVDKAKQALTDLDTRLNLGLNLT